MFRQPREEKSRARSSVRERVRVGCHPLTGFSTRPFEPRRCAPPVASWRDKSVVWLHFRGHSSSCTAVVRAVRVVSSETTAFRPFRAWFSRTPACASPVSATEFLRVRVSRRVCLCGDNVRCFTRVVLWREFSTDLRQAVFSRPLCIP